MTRNETRQKIWTPTHENSMYSFENITVGDVVKSNLNIHQDSNRYWRIVDIYKSERSNRIRVFAELSQDTKTMTGFDRITREFNFDEISEI